MNKTEAIVISAAVALAMVPRFEAKVEQFAKAHRTEIQMAMNELQGKPAVPFAVPEVSTAAAPRFELASYEQAFDERQMDAERSEEHTSELQSQSNLVCRLLLEKKKNSYYIALPTSTRPDAHSASRRSSAIVDCRHAPSSLQHYPTRHV